MYWQYVNIIASRQQQCLHDRASILHYTYSDSLLVALYRILRGQRRGSAGVRLLRLRVWIPSVCGSLSVVIVVCCRSSMCLADYLSWGAPMSVFVTNCDHGVLIMKWPQPFRGCCNMEKGDIIFAVRPQNSWVCALLRRAASITAGSHQNAVFALAARRQ